MTAKVVDASAIAAVAYAEPEHSAVSAKVDGCALHAPTLITFELTNVCLKKITRHPGDRRRLLEQLHLSKQIPMQLRDVDARQVVELARQVGLSSYDASYLWLASHLSLELVTLDQKLQRAAVRLGLSSASP